MSLRAWLPLNGNLNNQGLDEVTVTNTGATVDSSGKIGKCYSFSRTQLNFSKTFTLSIVDGCAISAWVYISTAASTCCILSNNSGGPVNFAVGLSDTNKLWVYHYNAAWYSKYSTGTITLNTWNHVAYVIKDSIVTFYINGQESGTATCTISSGYSGKVPMNSIGGWGSSYNFNGKLNDVRIYDHALSPKEVKEISKGLVLHYPLNDPAIQPMNNVWSNPTFNTSAAAGGANHWGGSGHIGTYGQNTDKQYIFDKSQPYSHWVADAAGATYNYLVYQSPNFSGGYRSFQCICKEETGIPITNNVCYPTWNGRDGGVPNNAWTSITSLGDGFYLCRCEGIHQDGSNNLVGIYIRAGYKVYFSEVYLENYRTVCSSILPKRDNMIASLSAGGRTTVSGGTVTTTGENADTYFYLNLSSPMVEGKAYAISCQGTNVADGLAWFFPVGSQTNTSCPFYIANGFNENAFIANSVAASGTKVILDDNGGSSTIRASAASFSDWSLHEIEKVYDCSGYSRDAAVMGGVTVQADSPRYEYSAHFNSPGYNQTNNYYYLRSDFDFSGVTEMTISFWCNLTAIWYGGFINTSVNGAATDYTTALINSYDGSFRFHNASGTEYVTPYPSADGVWRHIALVWNSNTLVQYVNGVQYDSKNVVGPLADSKHLLVNYSCAGGGRRSCTGNYSDIRIYTTALSASDIKELYETGQSIDNKGNIYAYEFKEE